MKNTGLENAEEEDVLWKAKFSVKVLLIMFDIIELNCALCFGNTQ